MTVYLLVVLGCSLGSCANILLAHPTEAQVFKRLKSTGSSVFFLWARIVDFS